jgi:Zn-dependent protease
VLFFQAMEKFLTWLLSVIIQYGVLLFAVSVHESAHAWMAYKFGDPTGKNQGRITLNPIPHIDPVGTIIIPAMGIVTDAPLFGWAKPVMVNPYNLRDPKKANIFISAAGPASNILAALAATGIFLILKSTGIIAGGGIVILIIKNIFFYFIGLNIYLTIFNLIPIPPLDGSWILEEFLRGEALYYYQRMKPYGFFIILLLIVVGVLDLIASPILSIVAKIISLG